MPVAPGSDIRCGLNRKIPVAARAGRASRNLAAGSGAGPILSQAAEHGDTVYLAGIVAKDLKKDVKGQTEEILADIHVRDARDSARADSPMVAAPDAVLLDTLLLLGLPLTPKLVALG